MHVVRPSILAALSFLFVLLLAASCSPAPGGTTETPVGEADLDLAAAVGGTARATGPLLEVGETYVVEVQGTYSIWGESGWQGGEACLGTSEPAPMFPSPDGANSFVGLDAEFWFGIAPVSSLCTTWSEEEVPNHTGRVEISVDGGSAFDHVEPIGGEPTAPDPEHRYRYEVTGQGHEILVQREDSATGDDYGVLKIRVFRVD